MNFTFLIFQFGPHPNRQWLLTQLILLQRQQQQRRQQQHHVLPSMCQQRWEQLIFHNQELPKSFQPAITFSEKSNSLLQRFGQKNRIKKNWRSPTFYRRIIRWDPFFRKALELSEFNPNPVSFILTSWPWRSFWKLRETWKRFTPSGYFFFIQSLKDYLKVR